MPSKQRIFFVANTSWSIYKFRLSLLQALVKKGYDVYVLAPRDKYSAIFEELEGIFFIELKKLNSKSISLADDLQLYLELLYHYRQLRPQLAFHYTIKANIFGSLAAARTGCPAVSVITGLGYMFTGKHIFKFAAEKLYAFALRKNKEVWFLNHDDQQIFIDHKLVAAEKTFLLPGEGVDSSTFYPAPYQQRQEPISFLLIARLIEHKGIYEFVQAAKILREKNLPVLCSLLGFFDDKSAVAISKEQLAQWQTEGSIVYLGETDEVAPFIEKADCIVLPSYREGLPLSLLEGASMSKALIASDVPGCRELVREGVNGFLCQPKDAAGLAIKMERYYNLPAGEKKAMGMAGREIVLACFTKEIITDIYINKLDSLKKQNDPDI
ncbi:MAG: glycosyltransferase family 4 protein [Chitinophagaceae bacterium]